MDADTTRIVEAHLAVGVAVFSRINAAPRLVISLEGWGLVSLVLRYCA